MDYAASTPVDARVLEAMRPYEAGIFGNPGAIHRDGQLASAAVFHAREKLAKTLASDFREIIFTASATEANNLALRGACEAAQDRGIKRPKIVISAIEHESVRDTARCLVKLCGAEVVEIPVNNEGIIDLAAISSALDSNTVIISVHYANSEIGTIQPISEIAQIVKNYKLSTNNSYLLFHTDAAQAFQYLPCAVRDLGVDLLTLSSHKIYGPKGAGALYMKNISEIRYPKLAPQLFGGGQESGFRSGTENVPAIVGFGEAAAIAMEMQENESVRVEHIRDMLWDGIRRFVPDAALNGPGAGFSASRNAARRLPNNLSIYFPGRPAQDLCIELDMAGLAVSPGSACSSRTANPSYVVAALGHDGDRPSSSVRFTLGRQTSEQEVADALTIFSKRFA